MAGRLAALFDKKTDARNLMGVNIGFCLLFALMFLFNFRDQYLFYTLHDHGVSGTRPTPKVLGLVPLPSLPEPLFLGCGALLVLCLVLAAVGFRSRLCLALAAILAMLYFHQVYWMGYLQRKPFVAICVLIALAVAPGIDRAGVRHWLELRRKPGSPRGEVPAWPLFLARAAVTLMYFAAGFSKLAITGPIWGDGTALQSHLLQRSLLTDIDLAVTLAQYPWLLAISSSGVLFLEFSFPIILFFPRLTKLYLLGGLGFHLGTEVLMHISYWKYMCFTYVVFFDWAAFERLRVRRPAPH